VPHERDRTWIRNLALSELTTLPSSTGEKRKSQATSCLARLCGRLEYSLDRCIAPDLIGTSDSDKLPDSGSGTYRFVEHRRYLGGLIRLPDDVKQ
jgi:hypothetical protein